MAKVLIAEDHELIRRGVVKIVENRYDAEVHTVETGTDLVERVLADDYTVVITDHSMPGITGLEAVKRIRASGSNVPVIVMSNEEPSQMSKRALAAGATYYVDKFDLPATLPSLLDLYLQKR